jgi:hypothetical protein
MLEIGPSWAAGWANGAAESGSPVQTKLRRRTALTCNLRILASGSGISSRLNYRPAQGLAVIIRLAYPVLKKIQPQIIKQIRNN